MRSTRTLALGLTLVLGTPVAGQAPRTEADARARAEANRRARQEQRQKTGTPVELVSDYVAANVGPVPASLGVSPFYRKYADALGIPVVASDKVPDAALLVARDLVNAMLAARPDLRAALIARRWRTGVIAETEMTMDIPEYATMKRPGAPPDEPVTQADRDYHANRSRGLGGNPTTGAEENLLGYPDTRYWGEHIFVHEFAHAIMGGGIRDVDPAMFAEIRAAYDAAMAAGRYVHPDGRKHYATTNASEYWAEGVQWWFFSNYGECFAGNVTVETPEQFAAYDPTLNALIGRVFTSHHLPMDVFHGKRMRPVTCGPQAAARMTITPATVLIDEPFQIALEGLEPSQDVTVRVEGNGGAWRSSATFRSDDRGRVEIADPMRLVWSATGERAAAPSAGTAGQSWTVTADIGGRVVATQTIVRRAVAEDVKVVPVRERGLVGTVYYPPGAGPHPAMIVLPGSQGGVPQAASFVGGLASRGYAVLALAYFNADGLPPLLQNIPLEYFATAVDWLKAQPGVDASRIGLMGTSRGAELALLLGATYPQAFRVVVANVPSNVVWPSLSTDDEVPAWTLNGSAIASVPSHFTAADRELSSRERFLKRLQDPAASAAAEIAVERIGGPLLLLSAKDDQLWPSELFATRIVDRLRARRFAHPVEHYSYEDAGHMIARPFVPTSDVRQVRIHPVSKRPVMMGGTPEGQARANVDAWAKLLAFLEIHLKKR